MDIQYHVYNCDSAKRIVTFYDRRDLGDYILILFPLGTTGDIIIQSDDGVTVATLCTVNDVKRRSREWLMCL